MQLISFIIVRLFWQGFHRLHVLRWVVYMLNYYYNNMMAIKSMVFTKLVVRTKISQRDLTKGSFLILCLEHYNSSVIFSCHGIVHCSWNSYPIRFHIWVDTALLLTLTNVPKVCLTQHSHVICIIRGNLPQKGILPTDGPKVQKWRSWGIWGVSSCYTYRCHTANASESNGKGIGYSINFLRFHLEFLRFTH